MPERAAGGSAGLIWVEGAIRPLDLTGKTRKLITRSKEGVETIRIVNPGKAIPLRHDDYRIFKSPLEDFRKAVTPAGRGDRVRCLSHGETYRFEVPESRLSPGSHR